MPSQHFHSLWRCALRTFATTIARERAELSASRSPAWRTKDVAKAGSRERAEIHGAVAAMAILVAATALFSTLTTEIKDGVLECRFGPGLIRKRIPMKEIKDVRAVRNRWYYGWGIRITPDGLLFNVSGLDAVKITLAGGGRFTIGTDRPRELEETIRRNAGLPISSSPIH